MEQTNFRANSKRRAKRMSTKSSWSTGKARSLKVLLGLMICDRNVEQSELDLNNLIHLELNKKGKANADLAS